MPYTTRATLFLLILVLQASNCPKKNHEDLVVKPSSPQVAHTHLASNNTIKEDPTPHLEFDPTFDLTSDPKFDPKFDSGYDSDTKPVSGSAKPPSTKRRKGNLNTAFDFEKNIRKMRQEADKTRKIHWHLSGDRLTRMVENGDRNLYALEDYVVMGLNIYRAAKKICELYGEGFSAFEDKADDLVKYAMACKNSSHARMEKQEDFWIKMIETINQEVVSYLQERKVVKDENYTQSKDEIADSINKKLRLAENYVGLDDTHYDITTVFTIEDKKFGLEDKKCFPLTANQKKSYENKEYEKWYNHLGTFEQKLMDAYAPKFVDDKHYIPTQLRKIPGCRNAYQKTVLAYDHNNNPIPLGRYYHSGSLASPIEWNDKESKAADWDITQDNWQQIQAQNKNIEVISLNYNMNVPLIKQLREKKIVEHTNKVVGEDKFMNLSINKIGTSFNVHKQYTKLVEDSLAFYKSKNKYGDLCTSFKKNNDRRIKNIQAIKDPKDKKFFELLVKLEGPANQSAVISNVQQTMSPNNPNADFCSEYIACRSVLSQETPDTSSVLVFCKSGKDRTGLMSYLVDKNIIQMKYPKLSTDQKLADCAHYQSLASLNGGMPGRFGMKSVKTPKEYDIYREQLFAKAARLTEIQLGEKEVGTIAN